MALGVRSHTLKLEMGALDVVPSSRTLPKKKDSFNGR